MLKTPFEYVVEHYEKKIQNDQKRFEFFYNQSDSLITWIIGFAFSGLLLIAANIMNLQARSPTKPIIICIMIIILFGIAFRYVSFIIMMLEKSLDDYYIGLFSQNQVMEFVSDPEIDKLDFDQILIRLKEDFDETINFPIPVTEDLKVKELPKLIQHYKNYCAYARRSLDIAIDHIAEIEYTTHRIPKGKTTEQFDKALKSLKTGYNARNWMLLRAILFSLCLLSFIVTIFIVSFSIFFIKS